MTSPSLFADAVYQDRIQRAREQMEAQGVDAMVLSLGSDVPYLAGASPKPSERLTALVITPGTTPVLVVPSLEAPLMPSRPGVFDTRPWADGEDPIGLVVDLLNGARTLGFGDQSRAQHLTSLLQRRPELRVVRASEVLAPILSIKDAAEQDAMRAASAAADRVIAALQQGRVALVGRTEADVADELARMLIDEGHQSVEFVIVASGPNAASPHHHAGDRVIQKGENVLFDIGGVLDGYCSDITRCVHLGPVPDDFAAAYDVLMEAQAAGTAAATVGTPCREIDRAARKVIEDAGYGELFMHRLGHGIGMSVHEDPYISEDNDQPLLAGQCFSIEPGIYSADQWGMRLENLVIAHDDGPETLNKVPREPAVLDV